uniref:Uncharacterized protein n=1 Tax=Schistosoma curassoni TaxID=6186 RepID=A0A183KSX9_9TREM
MSYLILVIQIIVNNKWALRCRCLRSRIPYIVVTITNDLTNY